MYVLHSPEIWRDFPELAAGALYVDGITRNADVESRLAHFSSIAERRLASATESQLQEIDAWRRTFSKMGLKPTQYRCAAESLLRRFRKERALPRIHPLIDLCNAISLTFAIPIAVFDVSQVSEGLEVRCATGSERYSTLSGDEEHPSPHEVIFADAGGLAHARRWTNRQSGVSVVRDTTTAVLIVAEAMHESARDDVARLIATVAEELKAAWSVTSTTAILSRDSPAFMFPVIPT